MSGQSAPSLREQLNAVNEILAKNPDHAEMQRRRHELGVETLQPRPMPAKASPGQRRNRASSASGPG
jgi:hypothetical protein